MSALAAIPNPFRDTVVQDAWQSPADVADIHRGVFDACMSGVGAAAKAHADSLLVHGPAGSGKTHLLTRVQRHLAETAREAPDRVLRCVFVYVRLQTSPQLLWQHVRRRLANDLMRRDQGLSQLRRLVAHQIASHSGLGPAASVMHMRLGPDDPALANYFADVAEHLELPRDLALVLEHLVSNRWVRDASAWLAGDSLPERILDGIGLGGDAEEDREAVARATVLGLCRLAAETLPVVFCFDQVEALQRSLDDREAFFRFGRLAADLHDADPNVFLVTCLQSALLPAFRESVRQADYDRLAKREASLEPLLPEQVRALVAARLAEPEGLRSLREAAADAPFFPFSAGDLGALERITPCVPRRVLAEAARRFEEIQLGRPPRTVEVPTFLTRELDERAPKTAALLGVGDLRDAVIRGVEVLSGLERIDVHAREPSRDVPEVDLVVESRDTKERVAVSVRDEADGRSLRPRLEALAKHLPRADGARLVVVRDPRVPLPARAAKAREHLETLRAKGAVVVEPSVEALAALATLAGLLADAKSGDLANDGETVTEGVVLAWMRSLSLREPFRVAPVEQLLGALFAPAPSADAEASRAALVEIATRRPVTELAAASQEAGIPPEKLLALARRSPDRWLVLEGPPTLLLDLSGVVADVEAAR